MLGGQHRGEALLGTSRRIVRFQKNNGSSQQSNDQAKVTKMKRHISIESTRRIRTLSAIEFECG